MRTSAGGLLLVVAKTIAVLALVGVTALFVINQGRPRNEAVWDTLPAAPRSHGRLAGSGYALVHSESTVTGGAAGWHTARGGGSAALSRFLDSAEPIEAVLVGDCHNSDALVIRHARDEGTSAAGIVSHPCDGEAAVSHFTLDPATLAGDATHIDLIGQLDDGVGEQVMRYMILFTRDGRSQISDADLINLFLAFFGGPLFLD